mgnify:CR=1 FL=1
MKQSLQSLADARLAPEWRQPVKTYDEAADALGWDKTLDKPICCGEPVEITAMLGSAYKATCAKCERFVFDITGPEFTGNAVAFVDSDKFDVEEKTRWVCGDRDGPLPRVLANANGDKGNG